jgi:PPOX class probable F420-dependent enzyme
MAGLTAEQVAFVEEPNYAVVATVDERGRPRSTVVWVDTDGTDILFNTTTKRAKARHLAKTPYVSVLVIDRDTPHRWLEVQGPVETTEEGAGEHINKLSLKYYGKDFHNTKDRLIVRVHPESIVAYDEQ